MPAKNTFRLLARLAGIAALLLSLPAWDAPAQSRIDGRVITSDSIPVHNAIVQLRSLDDTAAVYRALTDEQGRFSFLLTSVEKSAPATTDLVLHQNYPNPFSSSTTFTFSLPKRDHVSLIVCDMLGRRVRNVVDERLDAGIYTVPWDGRDEKGMVVPRGAYLCALRTQAGTLTRQLVALGGSFATTRTSEPVRIGGEARLKKSNPAHQVSIDVIDTTAARPRFVSEKCISLTFEKDTSIIIVVSTFNFDIYVSDFIECGTALYVVNRFDFSADTIHVGGRQRNVVYDSKRDRIYGVAGIHPGNVFAVDNKTRTVINNNIAGLKPDLPDSRILINEENTHLFVEESRSRIAIIDIDRDSVVGMIDDSTLFGSRLGITFAEIRPYDSTIFLRSMKTGEILTYDFKNGCIISRYKIRYKDYNQSPREAILHPDKKRMFIHAGAPAYILALDLDDSSVTYIGSLWGGFGHIAITPDGNFLLHTEYDGTINPIPGDLGTYVKLYDAHTYEYIDSISTKFAYKYSSFGLDEIAVSNNSTIFVVTPGGGGRGSGPLYICDIKRKAVVGVIPIEFSLSFTPISVTLVAK